VNYTLAGTATLTTDYTVTAGSNITAVTGSSFTIAEGQTNATLTINAAADNVADANETLMLRRLSMESTAVADCKICNSLNFHYGCVTSVKQ